MKEEILEKIRKDYEFRLEIKENLAKKSARLRELEENKYVKEYLEIINKKSNNNYKWYEYTSDDQILDISYRTYSREIRESNRLYVYLGSYKSDQNYGISCSYNDILVERDSPEVLYSIYWDLEKENEIKISIEVRDEFEKIHNIVYPETAFRDKEFYEIRRNFLRLSIYEGQEVACKKILKKD